MAFRVVKELENGLMEIIMKEILKIIKETAQVFIITEMETITMGNGSKIEESVEEESFLAMEEN